LSACLVLSGFGRSQRAGTFPFGPTRLIGPAAAAAGASSAPTIPKAIALMKKLISVHLPAYAGKGARANVSSTDATLG
jgi:hypothetical protein